MRLRLPSRTALVFASSFLALPVCAVLTAPLLARALGPVDRGVLAYALVLLTLASTAATFGQHETVTWAVARAGRPYRAERSYGVGLAVVAVLLSAPALLLLPRVLDQEELTVPNVIVAAALPFLLLANVRRGERLGVGDFRRVATERFVQAGLRTGLILVLFATGELSLLTALTMHCFAVVVATAALLPRVPTAPIAGEDWPRRPALVRYGMLTWLGSSMTFLVLRLDQLLLLPLAGAAELGFYVAAVAVAELPMVLGAAGKAYLFPRLAATRDLGLLNRTVGLLGAALLPVVLVGFVAAGEIVRIAFGNDFLPAVTPLRILLVGALLAVLVDVIGGAAAALGHPGAQAVIATMSLTITLVLVVLLVPEGGAIGAAWASTLAYTLTLPACLLLLHRLRSSARRVPVDSAPQDTTTTRTGQ